MYEQENFLTAKRMLVYKLPIADHCQETYYEPARKRCPCIFAGLLKFRIG